MGVIDRFSEFFGLAPPPPPPPPYLEVVTGFTIVIAALHLYLDVRQARTLAAAAKRRGPKQRSAACAYQLDSLTFGMYHSVFDVALTIITLWTRWLPYSWSLAAAWTGPTAGPALRSAAWAALMSVTSAVVGLPWSYYKTFIVEARHGFNRSTTSTFFTDAAKGLALSLALVPPIAAALDAILARAGPRLPLYLWLFTLALGLVAMTLYPTLIAPLFNSYSPLPPGPLRERIEALAETVGFPLRRLYVVDGSRRSSHSNAYMYGFFKNKRIVLFDTLIQQCKEGEVEAVLAHELGHWHLGHTPALFVATQAVAAAQFALFAAVRGAPGLHESFGFVSSAPPALAALVLFQLLTGPLDEALGVAVNAVTRRFEYQADGFAVGLGHATELKAALQSLDKENKGPPVVDPLYSAYHYSHPPMPERMAAIDAIVSKEK